MHFIPALHLTLNMPANHPLEIENDISACLQVLQAGGVILYPTDTIWGLGCDAGNADAVDRIFSIKRRAASKSMIVLLADARELLQYTANPQPAVFDFLEEVDHPTTVIYEGAIGLAANLIANDGTVGIRIVQDIFCRHLIKRLRKPLVSTSANISGEPAPGFFAEIGEEIRQSVDYIVKYRQEETAVAKPSSIVQFDRHGQLTVIRD